MNIENFFDDNYLNEKENIILDSLNIVATKNDLKKKYTRKMKK